MKVLKLISLLLFVSLLLASGIAIAVAGDSNNKLLTHPMDVTGEYIGYLCESLVRRGFLKKSSRGYQLTLKGREALFEFLLENKTRVIKDIINTLQQLGVEYGQKIDELLKEVIEAK